MSNDYDKILERLDELSNDKNEDLTKDDVEKLKKIIKFLDWLVGLGVIGKFIIWLILTGSAVWVAVSQFKATP